MKMTIVISVKIANPSGNLVWKPIPEAYNGINDRKEIIKFIRATKSYWKHEGNKWSYQFAQGGKGRGFSERIHLGVI